MLEHNGNGLSGSACIYTASKYDINPNNLPTLPRLKYYTWDLYSSVDCGSVMPLLDSLVPGSYNLYYTNVADNAFVPVINVDTAKYSYTIDSIRYIVGDYCYSSSGVCSFMGNGTIKNYSISGYNVELYPGYVYANSYGYIKVVVKDKEFPCSDKCKRRNYVIFHWKKCRNCFN